MKIKNTRDEKLLSEIRELKLQLRQMKKDHQKMSLRAGQRDLEYADLLELYRASVDREEELKKQISKLERERDILVENTKTYFSKYRTIINSRFLKVLRKYNVL